MAFTRDAYCPHNGRGHLHSSIVGHCYWFVQNCGANGWWPAGYYDMMRRRAARSGVDEDGDESPRSGHGNDDDDGVWYGGRDGGWNGATRSNFCGMPMKLIFYWEKCNVPAAVDAPRYGSAYGDRRDLVNGGGDEYTSSGDARPTGDETVVARANRRRERTAGRRRPRVVRGGDWF